VTGMKDAVEWNLTEAAVQFHNLLAEQRWCWASHLRGEKP